MQKSNVEEFWPQITQRDDEAWVLASNVYLQAKQKADLAAKELETAEKDLLRLTTQDYTCGTGLILKRLNPAPRIFLKVK